MKIKINRKFAKRIFNNIVMLAVSIAIMIRVFGNNTPAQSDSADTSVSGVTRSEIVIVNINAADLDELQTLPSIGEVKARAIIKYREEYGDFASVDDLVNVSGIGEKTLEKIRKYLTI